MPITDVIWRLTVVGPANGDTTAGTPNGSLGSVASTTALAGGVLGNLFDPVTGDEAAVGDTEYRALALLNNDATRTLTGVVIWLASETASGASAAVGIDPTAATAKGAAAPQGLTIASEAVAPAGVAFSSPTTKGTGLALGDLGPGQLRFVWVRRVVPAATGAINLDGVVIRGEGDSPA